MIKDKDWYNFLKDELESSYFKEIISKLDKEIFTIYPSRDKIFNAFEFCPLDKLKVVIISQDPYHNPGQANGLAFSVDNKKLPPSLQNIFHELKSDLGIIRTNGDLSDWASQGVLLLNTILTVRQSLPMSHRYIGWQNFTDRVIERLAWSRENIVFILWGNQAQEKKDMIKESIHGRSHYVLISAHPSPYSVKGFYGCKHFSKTNEFLELIGERKIKW
jgi:uracil-DNA glycosylase